MIQLFADHTRFDPMSDDESAHSDSSSDESEDINVTGLVATRARRGNAGNLYETLRAHLDDEELQKELLAEDEADDAESYDGTDVDGEDDNDVLDSSSDDDDAGPPKEGDAEDLAGEKELLKAERAAISKKRKAQAARLTVPAWHKSVKKVKLAHEVTADDGSSLSIEPAKKKAKKFEIGDFTESGPKRQSIRASAVANRETTQANLEESAQRARKQKATTNESIKRERANARADLTPEQRLEKCKRIEKETAKELGRFEREEAERVRAREEALMAKRRRHLEGPVIKTLTTSGYYENGKLKVKRLLHGSQTVDEIENAQKMENELVLPDDSIDRPPSALQKLADVFTTKKVESAEQQIQPTVESQTKSLDMHTLSGSEMITNNGLQTLEPSAEQDSQHAPASTLLLPTTTEDSHPSPLDVKTAPAAATDETGSAGHNEVVHGQPQISPVVLTDAKPLQPTDDQLHAPAEAPTTLPTSTVDTPQHWASETHTFSHITSAVMPPPAPVLREQAQRCMVILESFDSLDATAKRSKTTSGLEPTAVAQVLFPDSYPSFTDEQATYLRKARKLKQELLPKPRCALTTWAGKYKDPKTGVVFADVAAYKMLQRMIAGGCTWNSMLECWTGPAYGQMGRPARGVPDGFDKSTETVKVEEAPA